MNFFRCNKCYEPLRLSNPPFSLTQCGHIFCNKCASKDKQCFKCKTTGVESLPLTQPLPNCVAPMFTPASDLLEQYVIAHKFQDSQIMISMGRFREIERKYNGMKMAFWKLRKHMEEMTKNYKYLEEWRQQCLANHKIAPSQHTQGFVNIPRSYFQAGNHQSNNNQRNSNSRPSQTIGVQPNARNPEMRFNINTSHEGYQTDDSMNSVLNNRMRNNIETPPITPDLGVFRIPSKNNLPNLITPSSSRRGNSSDSSTPLIRKKMF